MTTDVRTLLHDNAETPSRGPDIEGAMRSARDRRRRRGGIGALVAVVVVALVGGVLVATSGGGSDDARVAIGPGQTTETPDGWNRIVTAPGVTIAIPPGWDTYDFGRIGDDRPAVAVGTGPLPDHGVPVVCTPADSLEPGSVVPTTPGTWIMVWESPDPTSTTFPLPAGDVISELGPRPESFQRMTASGGGCDHLATDPANDLAGAFTEFGFTENGRAFGGKVVTVFPAAEVATSPKDQAALDALKGEADALLALLTAEPPPANMQTLRAQYDAVQNQYYKKYAEVQSKVNPGGGLLQDALRILDTLTIEPRSGTTATMATTTTLLHDGSVPPTVTAPPTTLPPFAPTTDDERAITALITRWLHYQDDDGIRETLIGADSILDLIHEGTRQYQANMPDGYSGQLQALEFPDATHADFVFTLLLHGKPLYTNQRGAAVKVDGRWMITRESECSLLALGQLICPPE